MLISFELPGISPVCNWGFEWSREPLGWPPGQEAKTTATEAEEKNEISSKTINKIEKQLPHTCPLVPKDGNAKVKKRKDIVKTIIYYLGILFIIAAAVFLSNIFFEIIYFNLKY